MIFAAALNMKMIRTNKFIIDNQKKPRDLEDDDGSNRYHESGSNSRQQQCADVHRSRRGVRTRKRRLGAWDQECFVANCCCWCCLSWCMRQEMEMEIIALHEMGCRVTIIKVATQEGQKLTWLVLIDKLTLPQCVFCFFCCGGGCEISPNFDLKNMISTYTKDFICGKKMEQIRQILEKKIPNRQIFMISSSK